MLGKGIAVSSGVALVALVLIMQTTTPTTIGPLGVLVVFVLLYIAVLGVLTFLLYGGSYALARMSRSVTVRRPLQALPLARSYYFSSVLALAPVMLVGIQSVADIGVYDVLLVGLFVVMACVYIRKRI